MNLQGGKGQLLIAGLVFLISVAACAGPQPQPAKEAPPPVAPAAPQLRELTVPQIKEQPPPQLAAGGRGKLFTLKVRDGDLRDVLIALARESGENLVVDPGVSGTITVDLYRVTLEQALDAILGPLGYTYRKQGKVIRISRRRLETRIYQVSYIGTSRRGEKKIVATHGTSAKGEKVSGSESSVTGSDEIDPWVEIQEGLTAIVFDAEKPEEVIKARKEGPVTSLTSKDGKKLVISRMTGLVLVRDYPEKLQEVAAFLEQVEGSVQRQVLIEAKIFEVTLKNEYRTGIRWDQIQTKLANLDVSSLNFSYNIAGEASRSGILAVTGATPSTPFVLSDLVQALEVQGKVNTLASPRVATLNNQPALVKITDQDVYFESESTITDSGLQQTTFTPNVVDIGIILDVTPQIAADGSIIMNIHPSFSEKIEDVEVPASISGAATTTFPLLSVRETDTVVRVKDGQTIIIAGLLKDSKSDTRTGLPCLMSLPVVGHLFRYTENIANKSELVILLTPHVLVGKRIDELSADELKKLGPLGEGAGD